MRMPHVPPTELVACVGSSQIDGATLDHWMRIAWLSSSSLRRHPKLHALDNVALGFLIQAEWITDEAAAQGVSVSDAEARAQFLKLRKQQFPHMREFEAFLRSSGYTVSDLLFRTRINMLSSRIARHAIKGHSTEQRMRALTKFARDLELRWSSQTYCAARLKIRLCGHPLPAT